MGSLTYHPLNIYLKIMVGGSSRENCLHVRGCHRDTRDSDVHSMFGKYGTIIDTHIPLDYYTQNLEDFSMYNLIIMMTQNEQKMTVTGKNCLEGDYQLNGH